jgi:hypothetical protein
MSEGWIPRCEHGSIILGCLIPDCGRQNDYIAKQEKAMVEWDERMQAEARAIVRGMLGLDA